MALLLIPSDRIAIGTIVMITALALLSGLVARHWGRFVPYLRSHPLIATLDIFATGAVLVLDGPSGAAFITTVISSAIAGILFGERAVILVVALQIFTYACALLGYTALYGPYTPVEVQTFQVLLVHPALYPVAGYLGLKVRAMLAELASEQAARRDAELAAAAAEERERLARDMHDSVAKTLRGAAMAAQSLPMWVKKNPERAATVAEQIAEAADAATLQARELISGLREKDLKGSTGPFIEVVSAVVADWGRNSGVEVAVRQNALPDLEGEAQSEALAIVKEALTNVERHAQASRVEVIVGEEGPDCAVTITDNGRGFATPPEELLRNERAGNGHYGLLGMVERAERVGGSLAFTCPYEGGTQVQLRVPGSVVSPSLDAHHPV
ncbi:sensor histidine kinase [Nocardiopsis halophila]|uniref:sensor histidine kinase n=1 Tax=Nocardiopsis halophila TaxID=141692 RepID=UPI00034A490B|nr:histidine kinase [Nocardiopsis halophila]